MRRRITVSCGRRHYMIAAMAPSSFAVVIIVVLVHLVSIADSNSTTCPSPCQCGDDDQRTITCRGCPTSYITAEAFRIYVDGCDDIQYLLRLHHVGFNLTTLDIRNSRIRQPEAFIYADRDVRMLTLHNASIVKLNAPVAMIATNLTVLNLSRNRIELLNNRTFVMFDKMSLLNLSDNRIANLAGGCFEGMGRLLILDLSSNNLSAFSDEVFAPLVSLRHLNLSINGLRSLSERSFRNLPLLQQLDISYNKLTRVAPGTLQFLPNLAKLVMTDNPQLKPDAQVFVGTGRRLQQVDASRTGLSQVPEALTQSVRFLTLTGNQIASVRGGDLDSYPLLQVLDFTNNVIFDIEDDALGRLELLSHLYLKKNKLTTVPKMLPNNLSYLSLDSNDIKNLTAIDFISLSNLKVLIISNNNISFVQENTFVQLVALETLDISNNPLKLLTPNTFSGPAALRDLRITHVSISPPAKDISFPVPSPEGIENLDLEYSPGLTMQLMSDTAALAAMTRLRHLNIQYSNLTNLRSDLLHFLPELKVLKLEGNKMNCTEVGWLVDWMHDFPNNDHDRVRCFSPASLKGKLVRELEQTSERHLIRKNISNAIMPTKHYENKKPTTSSVEKSTIISKVAIENAKSSNSTTSSSSEPVRLANARSDLLRIFSEWSQEPTYNKAPPCENKTKCNEALVQRKIGEQVGAEETTHGNATSSRFSVALTRGTTGTGVLLAALGVVVVIAAAVAAAWASRRRPRPRQGQDLMMEVPTIAAVGELW